MHDPQCMNTVFIMLQKNNSGIQYLVFLVQGRADPASKIIILLWDPCTGVHRLPEIALDGCASPYHMFSLLGPLPTISQKLATPR